MKNLLFIFLLAIPFGSFSQEFPTRSNRLVNDYSNTLSSSDVQSLEDKLVAYDRESSVQIAIVIMKTLDGYPIDDYAFQLGEKWGIGRSGNNTGALILVSMEEHKMWIATGYGLEGTLTDAMSKRIVENEMKPRFRNNDYAGGLAAASDAIILVTRGEYQGNGGDDRPDPAPIAGGIVIVLVLMLVWIVKAFQVKSYAKTNHLGFLAAWMLLNSASRRHSGSWTNFSGGSGGFSGGGGGGGFGGFGGGSFGGGGAGGSW
ncbi:MAG: TPM domain-containing protein [Flavobacteriales bacterium]|nr:TPM domain-containing protein [Flavobacteriales bacterium]